MLVATIRGNGRCIIILEKSNGYTPILDIEVEVDSNWGYVGKSYDFATLAWSGESDDASVSRYHELLSVNEVKGLFTRTEVIAILDSVNTTVIDYLRLLDFYGGTIDVTDVSNDYAAFIAALRTDAILTTDARRDDLLLGKLIV